MSVARMESKTFEEKMEIISAYEELRVELLMMAWGSDQVIHNVLLGQELPESLIGVLCQTSDEDNRYELAMECEVPSLLQRFARDDDSPKVRGMAALNPNLPVSTMPALSRDSDENVRAGLAGNSSAPEVVQAVLAGDKVTTVRAAVAGNSSAPEVLQTVLAGDKATTVRVALAKNELLSEVVQETLAGDRLPSVRAALAGSPRTADYVLWRLTSDPSVTVRREVAHNRYVLRSVMERLLGDEDPKVRAIARMRVSGNLFVPLRPTDPYDFIPGRYDPRNGTGPGC